MMGYLYVFHHATEARIKIGKSLFPVNRAQSLKLLDKIDPRRSHQLHVSDNGAYKIEKFLHYIFDEYSVEMDFQDGYTEWFDSSCYDKLIRYLVFISHEEDYELTNIDPTVIREHITKKKDRLTKLQKNSKPIRLRCSREFNCFIEMCAPFLFIIDCDDSVKICFYAENDDDVNKVKFWFSNKIPTIIPPGLHDGIEHKNVSVSINGGKTVQVNESPSLRLSINGPRFGYNLVSGYSTRITEDGKKAIGYLRFNKSKTTDPRPVAKVRSHVFREFDRLQIPTVQSTDLDDYRVKEIEEFSKIPLFPIDV